MKFPRLFWLTGLSGAGKTTIGKMLYQYLKSKNLNTIFIDGDKMRWVLENISGHTHEERKKLAFQYSRFCKMLVDQEVNVVCSTISMYHEVRNWNRENFENYTEIYIKVPIEELKSRDQKGLYTDAKFSDNNLVGINIEFEEPINSDIILINDGKFSIEEVFKILLKELNF